MYANNVPPMVAGANMPSNVPPMVAGVMDTPMPCYGYGPAVVAPAHGGNTFLLIVVLFILLIIVGCSFPKC